MEMLEETWNNYQVYMNDEINFIDDESTLDWVVFAGWMGQPKKAGNRLGETQVGGRSVSCCCVCGEREA